MSDMNALLDSIVRPQYQTEAKIIKHIWEWRSATAVPGDLVPLSLDSAKAVWQEFWDERHSMASVYYLEMQRTAKGELACNRGCGWSRYQGKLYRTGIDKNGEVTQHYVRDL